jgi:hypothetical protein
VLVDELIDEHITTHRAQETQLRFNSGELMAIAVIAFIK